MPRLSKLGERMAEELEKIEKGIAEQHWDTPFGPAGYEPDMLAPKVTHLEQGTKFDQTKDPWALAPWDAFRAVVKVLAFGAGKYAPRNWEKGMDWSRVFSAVQRHLTAWWNGEGLDPETGYSHLWHAGCCIAFLIAYELRGTGLDDRPAKQSASQQ